MSQGSLIATLGAAALGVAAWFYQSSQSAEQEAEAARKRRLELLAEQERKKKEEENSLDPKLFVYFGSQTGTAEGFAKTIADNAKRHGFIGKVIDLEEFKGEAFEQLIDEKGDKIIACFCVATYGEGDPSDNAIDFSNYLKASSHQFGNLRFTVFGLGNRQYEHFNAMGKFVDQKFEELGAKRVYKYGEGDDDGTLQVNSFQPIFHIQGFLS